MSKSSVPCDCCGGPAPRLRESQEWGFCDECREAGCCSKRDGEGGMLRGQHCPLRLAGADVVMCLHCGKPLHKSEPLTYVDNTNPGRGGCHARCVQAYWQSRDWSADRIATEWGKSQKDRKGEV